MRRALSPTFAVLFVACGGSGTTDPADAETVADASGDGSEASGPTSGAGDGDGTSGDGDGTSGDGDGTSGDGDGASGDGDGSTGDGDGSTGDSDGSSGDGDGSSGDGDGSSGDGDGSTGDGDGSTGDGDGDGDGSTGDGDGDGSTGDGDGSTGDGDGDGDGAASCGPYPPATGNVVAIALNEPDLAGAVASAAPGTTLEFEDGVYTVPSGGLWPGPGVTIRSASGDWAGVVFDGAYAQTSGGVFNVLHAADVTLAEITILQPRFHGVHVTGASTGFTGYRIRIVDPGEQAIKVNENGGFPDSGELACSELRLTDSGRQQVMMYTSSGSNCYTGGVDAHEGRDWIVRDSYVEGFWCSNGDLSEHGIHFWDGARDTIVERNTVVDCARGIGFGLTSQGRTYADDPCPGVPVASHYGGVIRNNLVVAKRAELFASPTGFDSGISLAYACDAAVVHNTVASTDTPFNSIEWRFPETTVDLVNNLVTHNLLPRDGATATPAGNIESAPLSMFVDVAGGDAHLDPANASAAIDQGDLSGLIWVTDDVDGELRDATPDVGADEI